MMSKKKRGRIGGGRLSGLWEAKKRKFLQHERRLPHVQQSFFNRNFGHFSYCFHEIRPLTQIFLFHSMV